MYISDNKYRKKQHFINKTYSILFMLIAIAFLILLALPCFSIGYFGLAALFLVLAIINFVASRHYSKRAKEYTKSENVEVENITTPTSSDYVSPVQNESEKVEAIEHPQPETSTPSTIDSNEEAAPQEPVKKEHHRVAGTSYRTDNILTLAIKNPDYSYSKKEMLEMDMINEPIYEYLFPTKKVELIEEPDNKYDPNAIKVVVNDVHIGYIKKGSCSHVKKLIREDRIENIYAFIGGGKCKYLTEKEDDYSFEESYVMARETKSYFCELTFILK